MNKSMYRSWGSKDVLYYCPINKIVWQIDKDDRVYKYRDMPSYGLERKVLV